MAESNDFFKYLQNIINTYENNHHLEDIPNIYDENLFLKDYKVIENIKEYFGTSNAEKEKLKFQALQAQQVYINSLKNKVDKICNLKEIFYLLDKDEYDEEVLDLKELHDDRYLDFEKYIIDIQCEINDLSKAIIGRAIADLGKKESYKFVLKKSIEFSNNIKEFGKYDEGIKKGLVSKLKICIIEDVHMLYNLEMFETNNIVYYKYLMKYKDDISKFEFIDKITREKIIFRIKKDIMRIFEESFACIDNEANLYFCCNDIIKNIMQNIISVCSKENFYNLENKYIKKVEDLTISIDLNQYSGLDIQIRDIHKKIFIYICHLVYKDKSQVVKFKFDDFIELAGRAKRDKYKIIESIKQLNCIYFQCNYTYLKLIEKYKLIEILKIEKDYIEIKVCDYICNNDNKNILMLINKDSFKFKESGGSNCIGNEFSLALELIMHMFLNKDDYEKRDEKGFFRIKTKKILFELLGYKEVKGNSFSYLENKIFDITQPISVGNDKKENNEEIQKTANKKEVEYTLKDTGWQLKTTMNINRHIYGSIKFKNEQLLIYKEKFE